ncbi:MAG: hypothetical protein QOG73_3633, partial [Acetobacteraceae bacterium]|nr:hypothetical protein [Acetobacteraceae bacterium]
QVTAAVQAGRYHAENVAYYTPKSWKVRRGTGAR